MGRTLKIIVILLLILIAWVALGEYPPAQNPSESIGSWEFVSGTRKSCLDILPEGKYKHVVYNNGAVEYEHQGKWKIDSIDSEKRITFDKFRSLQEDGTLNEHSGYWPAVLIKTFFTNELRLMKSFDRNLYYSKIKHSCANNFPKN